MFAFSVIHSAHLFNPCCPFLFICLFSPSTSNNTIQMNSFSDQSFFLSFYLSICLFLIRFFRPRAPVHGLSSYEFCVSIIVERTMHLMFFVAFGRMPLLSLANKYHTGCLLNAIFSFDLLKHLENFTIHYISSSDFNRNAKKKNQRL